MDVDGRWMWMGAADDRNWLRKAVVMKAVVKARSRLPLAVEELDEEELVNMAKACTTIHFISDDRCCLWTELA